MDRNGLYEHEEGAYIHYADHVAALAEAYTDGNVDGLRHGAQSGYERGVSDERARIRTGVTPLPPWVYVDNEVLRVSDNEEES